MPEAGSLSSRTYKICIVGAAGVGKTAITRILADWEPFGSGYAPTVGTRIQEIERLHPSAGSAPLTFQLWDCSGDAKFQSCWPALVRNVHGLVLVYNADALDDQEKQLEKWYTMVAVPNRLTEGQCRVVAARSINPGALGPAAPKASLQGKLRQLKQIVVDLTDASCKDHLQGMVDSMVGAILERQKAMRDDEERRIMDGS